MFEHNHLYLYLISKERAKEWVREMTNEGSWKTVESGTKSNSRLPLKLRFLSIFTNRRPSAQIESYPETICCQ
jgi:hypothetical protein